MSSSVTSRRQVSKSWSILLVFRSGGDVTAKERRVIDIGQTMIEDQVGVASQAVSNLN